MLTFVPQTAAVAELPHKPSGKKLIITLYAAVGTVMDWKAHAFETGIDNVKLDEVFADHSHVTLADGDSYLEALSSCRSYARRWLQEKGRPAEKCPCEPISLQ